MNLYRFRIELTDAPGSLAAIARAFAAADANICEFDVQTIDGQVRADELLVEVAPGNDAEALGSGQGGGSGADGIDGRVTITWCPQ